MNKYLWLLVFFFPVLAANAAVLPEADSVQCPPNAIQIDGRLNEPEWQKAFYIPNLVEYKSGIAAQVKTEVFVLNDDQNLYVAFKCAEPQMAELLARRYRSERDSDIWNDDCVEIFVSNGSLYHFIINSHNVKLDEKDDVASWNGLWDSAVGKGEDYWLLEMKLPFHTLELRPGSKELTLNFCREKYTAPSEISSWAFTQGRFVSTDKYARLKNIQRNLPDIHIDHIDWGSLLNGAHRVNLQLSNTSGNPWKGNAALIINDVNGQRVASYATPPLQIGANQEITTSIDYNAWQKEGDYIKSIELMSQYRPQPFPLLSKSVLFPSMISFWRQPTLLLRGEQGIIQVSLNSANPSAYKLSMVIKNSQGKIIKSVAHSLTTPLFSAKLPTTDLSTGSYTYSLELLQQNQPLHTYVGAFEIISNF